MKKVLLLLTIILLSLTGCGDDKKDEIKGSGWLQYKGKTYLLHHVSHSFNDGSEPIEGLWLHAAAFASSDATASAGFSFYCQTPDIEARTYTYNGISSTNGTVGELTPASVQIPGEKIMLPVSTIVSGSLTIKHNGSDYEFSFNFVTTSGEDITGYYNGSVN